MPYGVETISRLFLLHFVPSNYLTTVENAKYYRTYTQECHMVIPAQSNKI